MSLDSVLFNRESLFSMDELSFFLKEFNLLILLRKRCFSSLSKIMIFSYQFIITSFLGLIIEKVTFVPSSRELSFSFQKIATTLLFFVFFSLYVFDDNFCLSS